MIRAIVNAVSIELTMALGCYAIGLGTNSAYVGWGTFVLSNALVVAVKGPWRP